MVDVLRITDDTTREEICEALHHVCEAAHRQQCIVGTPDHPSAYDLAHRRLDALLDEWCALTP